MADITGYLNIISGSSNGESVRDAIINCMKAINADSAVQATSLLITKSDNRTYKPGTGKAFRSVTVNIDGAGESDPSKTLTYEDFNVDNNTENGTYDAGENTVYGRVNVNIDWTGIDDGIDDEATMTFTKTDPVSGRKYWDPDMENYKPAKRIWIATDVGLPGEGEDGTGGNGPFVVTFLKENGTVLTTISDIEKYSSIRSEAPDPGPSSKGETFSGWLPANGGNLDSVTKNFKCKPDYVKLNLPGTIADPWETVIENHGKPYGIGSTLDYYITNPVSLGAITLTSAASKNSSWDKYVTKYKAKTYPAGASLGSITFMKVAAGEYGTGSTWLSTTPVALDDLPLEEAEDSPDSGYANIYGDYGCDSIRASRWYQLLDKVVLQLFQTSGLNNAIVAVPKPTFDFASYGTPLSDFRRGNVPINTTAVNMKIWIPSFAEIGAFVKPALADPEHRVDEYWDIDKFYDKTSMDVEQGSADTKGTHDYAANGWRPTLNSLDPCIITRSTTFCSAWHSVAYPRARGVGWNSIEDYNNNPLTTSIVKTVSIDDDKAIFIGFCL